MGAGGRRRHGLKEGALDGALVRNTRPSPVATLRGADEVEPLSTPQPWDAASQAAFERLAKKLKARPRPRSLDPQPWAPKPKRQRRPRLPRPVGLLAWPHALEVVVVAPATTREVAEALGVTKGRARALLVWCARLGLVDQDAWGGPWRLTPDARHAALDEIRARREAGP